MHTQVGGNPRTYGVQPCKTEIVPRQVGVIGWSLKRLSRPDISQDDLNLLPARYTISVCDLPSPLTRMFREP